MQKREARVPLTMALQLLHPPAKFENTQLRHVSNDLVTSPEREGGLGGQNLKFVQLQDCNPVR